MLPPRAAASDPPAAAGHGGLPDIKARGNSMEPHYRRNVETVRLRPPGRPVALVGSIRYHQRSSAGWRRVEPDGLAECVLPDAEDHADCFREPCVSRWLDFLEEWYAGLPSADTCRSLASPARHER